MLDSLKGKKKAVGIKQVMKAVEDGTSSVVFIAKDADERVIGPLESLCIQKSVELIYIETMKQLGKACNIDVGASAAALFK